jgi:hypothetical protein
VEVVSEGGLSHFNPRWDGTCPSFGWVEVKSFSGHSVVAGSEEEGGLRPVSRVGAVKESPVEVQEGQGMLRGVGF